MPELPEVETVRRGLEPMLRDAQIDDVIVRERRLRWLIESDLPQRLTGQRINSIERRSKYLLFRIHRAEQPSTLLAHLGMTGSFIVHEYPAATPGAHDHVDIILRHKRRSLVLRYNDPRRFGSIHHFTGEDRLQPLLRHLGPEPLTDVFTGDVLYEQTRRRTGPIKQAIMDNTLVVGIGNIYANESLFRAGIYPGRAANRIALARYERLAGEIKAVLGEAIAAGGSTLRNFVNASGESGYFQLDYFVYGRSELPCKLCATPLKHMRHGGRATVYCPVCQR